MTQGCSEGRNEVAERLRLPGRAAGPASSGVELVGQGLVEYEHGDWVPHLRCVRPRRDRRPESGRGGSPPAADRERVRWGEVCDITDEYPFTPRVRSEAAIRRLARDPRPFRRSRDSFGSQSSGPSHRCRLPRTGGHFRSSHPVRRPQDQIAFPPNVSRFRCAALSADRAQPRVTRL